jgi:CRP/FNR family cyclic AMP-dependent transcriptional regulator
MSSKEEIADELGSVSIFRDLSPKARKSIAEAGREVSHAAGAEVTSDGQSGVGFHLITAGSADVIVGGEVRRTLGPGEYFGEIALIDGKPRSATVRANDDGLTTFALTAWVFKPLLEENPSIAVAMLQALCERIRSLESN